MINHTIQIEDTRPNTKPSAEDINKLVRALSTWYVRMDGKYFDAANPTNKFNREDIQAASIHRFHEEMSEIPLTDTLLRDAFDTAFVRTSLDRTLTIPTWNGTRQCIPGETNRFIWQHGMVSLNSWAQPHYRTIQDEDADPGTVRDFMNVILPNAEHRSVFLNWLAWCLQNEADKPTWGPLLYSKKKGTGKSTLCDIVTALFGRDNSIRQNNVDKLTGKFNMELMLSKFIVSEELEIRPGTRAGNALKTFMTETEAVSEAKGREVQRVQQRFCCMFTTNHLPLWIEDDDRRYWIVDVDHDGHAGGPDAAAFNELVGNVKEYIKHDAHLIRLYNWLMQRELPEGFTGKAFDIEKYQTPTMELIFGNGAHTTLDMMREYLDEMGLHVLREADVVRVVVSELKANPASTKHLMSELGWHKVKVKWGGVDYQRAIWVRPQYHVERGEVFGPDGFRTDLTVALPDDPATMERLTDVTNNSGNAEDLY